MLNFIKRVKNSFISRIKEQKKRYEINKYKKAWINFHALFLPENLDFFDK